MSYRDRRFEACPLKSSSTRCVRMSNSVCFGQARVVGGFREREDEKKKKKLVDNVKVAINKSGCCRQRMAFDCGPAVAHEL